MPDPNLKPISPPNSLSPEEDGEIKISKLTLWVSSLVLLSLTVFVIVHFSEAKRFAGLLAQAQPGWLIIAIGLQLATYACAGAIWYQVVKSAGYHIPLRAVARLSIEKLSIDQLVPTGGLAGNFVIFHTLQRRGLPHWLALEALLVDILSHYLAFAITALVTLVFLWFYHDITPIIHYLVSLFTIILVSVPTIILWLLAHRQKKLPERLLRFHFVARISAAVKDVSPRRIYAPKVLALAGLFNATIFLLDAGTLWTTMRIAGAPVGPLVAFAAVIIASIAGTISFLPGGIGGFEAGAVIILTLLGSPLSAAVAGTLLLRGLTLWLPLIPGLLLARRDAHLKIKI